MDYKFDFNTALQNKDIQALNQFMIDEQRQNSENFYKTHFFYIFSYFCIANDYTKYLFDLLHKNKNSFGFDLAIEQAIRLDSFDFFKELISHFKIDLYSNHEKTIKYMIDFRRYDFLTYCIIDLNYKPSSDLKIFLNCINPNPQKTEINKFILNLLKNKKLYNDLSNNLIHNNIPQNVKIKI